MGKELAIQVRHIGKRYKIGQREPYKTLRDAIANMTSAPIKLLKQRNKLVKNRSSQEYFWALKDISFDVERGEIMGFFGRNGAGKSTLLKILSRITMPTEGDITMHGRVGSLLEVGTGFHPELTGRENIFLNGSILGMRKGEIEDKFDEIVKFSDVERFLDTPVKRYSSGMYVRLAFAVAANFDSEILLVDEVLAVGDSQFQKKCLAKMGQIAEEGRTVLLISHNLASISALCSKAIVLKGGSIDFLSNNVNEAIQHYLGQIGEISKISLADRTDRQGKGQIRMIHFAPYNDKGCEQTIITSGQFVDFRIYYNNIVNIDRNNIISAINIVTQTGPLVSLLNNQVASEPFESIPGQGYISCIVEKLPLVPGIFTVNLVIKQNEIVQDLILDAATLIVEPGDFYRTGKIPPSSPGCVFFDQKWSVVSV